jgi:cytochrome c oxidase accessory protein FixG
MTITSTADPPRPRVLHRPEIPQGVKGRFRTIKTALSSVLLAIFFVTPWLRWDRGSGLPGQAVMIDLPGRRMVVFGLEFWPQDLPIAVGLLVCAALSLFAATTIAGRVWCGFACPQTVWSDLYFGLDRLIVRLVGRGPKERAARTLVWIVIAFATALTFTAYFLDAPTLAASLLHGTASGAAYLSVLVLTGTTWLLAASARERVCLHMCPWPRFQAALLDRQSLVVTYQAWRGEPRGRKRIPLRPDLAATEPGIHALVREAADVGAMVATRGDCIDCARCVSVCPTRVDIRNGLQMGCIGCGLCIDACDDVMARIGRPPQLIRFDTDAAELERRTERRGGGWLRPKALVFAGAAAIAFVVSIVGIATTPRVVANVTPERNPPYVLLSDGSVRNDFALRVAHRREGLPAVEIRAEGLEGAALRSGAPEAIAADTVRLDFGSGRSLEERLLVSLPIDAAPRGRRAFDLVILDPRSHAELARIPSYFWGPEQ